VVAPLSEHTTRQPSRLLAYDAMRMKPCKRQPTRRFALHKRCVYFFSSVLRVFTERRSTREFLWRRVRRPVRDGPPPSHHRMTAAVGSVSTRCCHSGTYCSGASSSINQSINVFVQKAYTIVPSIWPRVRTRLADRLRFRFVDLDFLLRGRVRRGWNGSFGPLRGSPGLGSSLYRPDSVMALSGSSSR